MYKKQAIKKNSEFDFDEWVLLASTDPEAFEQRRLDCIESFISQCPSSRQHRLRGIQFQIDMERHRAKTPMAACIKISSMMWDSFSGPNGLATALNRFTHPQQSVKTNLPKPKQQSAKILHFTNKKDH
jgi:hypothetical protein